MVFWTPGKIFFPLGSVTISIYHRLWHMTLTTYPASTHNCHHLCPRWGIAWDSECSSIAFPNFRESQNGPSAIRHPRGQLPAFSMDATAMLKVSTTWSRHGIKSARDLMG
jgi:hypothetical protein